MNRKALRDASILFIGIAMVLLLWGFARADFDPTEVLEDEEMMFAELTDVTASLEGEKEESEDTIGPIKFGPMLTTQMIRMRFNPMQTSLMSSGLGGGFYAEYQTKKPSAFKPRGEIFAIFSSQLDSKEIDTEFGVGGSLLSIGKLQLGSVYLIYNPDKNEFSLGIGGSLTLWGKEL